MNRQERFRLADRHRAAAKAHIVHVLQALPKIGDEREKRGKPMEVVPPINKSSQLKQRAAAAGQHLDA